MDNEDYFDLKYLEDVHSLFQDLIQINQFYNLNLFQNNNNFVTSVSKLSVLVSILIF